MVQSEEFNKIIIKSRKVKMNSETFADFLGVVRHASDVTVTKTKKRTIEIID